METYIFLTKLNKLKIELLTNILKIINKNEEIQLNNKQIKAIFQYQITLEDSTVIDLSKINVEKLIEIYENFKKQMTIDFSCFLEKNVIKWYALKDPSIRFPTKKELMKYYNLYNCQKIGINYGYSSMSKRGFITWNGNIK